VTSDKPGKAASYKDLIVWQKGIALVRRVYEITRTFPDDESSASPRSCVAPRYLSRQTLLKDRPVTRRASPFGSYRTQKGPPRVETQLIIAAELKYCEKSQNTDAFEAVDEMRRMLNGLRRQLTEKLDQRAG
jgi:hypothetical protein